MNVRLEAWEIEQIIGSFRECFDKDDHIWLFGSRVNLHKRGGDIDLYIEITNFGDEKVYRQRQKFWILLQDRLGEQKIDIVIRDPGHDILIYQVARQEGIQLV